MVLDAKIVNHHLSKSSSALFLKAAAKPMKPRLFNIAQHFHDQIKLQIPS